MTFNCELVGKVGSAALADRENNDLNYNVLCKIARELRPGFVWVTSGAAEIGRLDYLRRNDGVLMEGSREEIKTDCAAQGQSVLMATYRQFAPPYLSLRQFLVEHSHFNDPAKREHLKDALVRCFSQKAVPIINYNDPVSNEETRKTEIHALKEKGIPVVECVDNDETASKIALLLHAKYLLIYTSTDGILYDPADASSLIREITASTPAGLATEINKCKMYCDGKTTAGTGGALAKLSYVEEAAMLGTTVFISSPKYKISDILSANAPSTRIKLKDAE
ncbi:MAG: uridylate kinase [Christensenellaceae bacterium]|jgi:glutamate 5-kinase|nr:uridylate kinase [Christensenellaceae bacterium]